jgi:hypothetical protein
LVRCSTAYSQAASASIGAKAARAAAAAAAAGLLILPAWSGMLPAWLSPLPPPPQQQQQEAFCHGSDCGNPCGSTGLLNALRMYAVCWPVCCVLLVSCLLCSALCAAHCVCACGFCRTVGSGLRPVCVSGVGQSVV